MNKGLEIYAPIKRNITDWIVQSVPKDSGKIDHHKKRQVQYFLKSIRKYTDFDLIVLNILTNINPIMKNVEMKPCRQK